MPRGRLPGLPTSLPAARGKTPAQRVADEARHRALEKRLRALEQGINKTLTQILGEENWKILFAQTRDAKGRFTTEGAMITAANQALRDQARDVREWTAKDLARKIESHSYQFFDFETRTTVTRVQRPTRLPGGGSSMNVWDGLLIKAIASEKNGRYSHGPGARASGSGSVQYINFATKSGTPSAKGFQPGYYGINSDDYFNSISEIKPYWERIDGTNADKGIKFTRYVVPLKPGVNANFAVRTTEFLLAENHPTLKKPRNFKGYGFRAAALRRFAGESADQELRKKMVKQLRLAGFKVRLGG